MPMTSGTVSTKRTQTPEILRDLELREVGPSERVSRAIHRSLLEGSAWLEENAPKARAGDVPGVHHLRTTTRRLRTVLDLFGDFIDSGWSRPIADDLKWLASALGDVRDLDVMKARFLREAEAIEAVEPLAPLFEGLDQRRLDAWNALAGVIESERYRAMILRLRESVGSVPMIEDAELPCRKVLPKLVEIAWKSFRKGARALSPDHLDEPFHDVRKRAKRARYAAEAVKDFLDSDSKRDAQGFARKARLVQDVLGEHQDAIIAADFLNKGVDEHPELGRLGFAAGRLLERELRSASESKARFFEVFPGLDRKRVVRWMTP